MSLISTPKNGGREIQIDFCYWTSKGKAKYYQHGSEEEMRQQAHRHLEWARRRDRVTDAEILHEPDKQRFLLTYFVENRP